MNLREIRENKNKPANILSMSATNKFFISQCLTAYVQGNEKLFNTFSDKTKELVESIFINAIKGNQSMLDQLLNRIEGKVKETIDLNTSIKSLQPNQEEQQELDNKYKLQPISIKAEPIKTLPEPSNAEQIDDNTQYTTNPDIIGYDQLIDTQAEYTTKQAVEKPDTLPDECALNSGQDNTDNIQASTDSIAGQDIDNWYNKTPHLIYRKL